MKVSDAVIEIICEARRERQPSNAAVKRLVSSLKLLGLQGQELIAVLSYLDICRLDGTPYRPDYYKRIW